MTTAAPDSLPHLILADAMMTEMDELALIMALWQHPGQKAILVVLLTARADLDTLLQALQLGVADLSD